MSGLCEVETIRCPMCEGPSIFMGNLGEFSHFVCRNCGMPYMQDTHFDMHAHFDIGEQNSLEFPFRINELDIVVFRVGSYGDDLHETVTFEHGLTVTHEDDIEEARNAIIMIWAELYQHGIKGDPLVTFDYEREE